MDKTSFRIFIFCLVMSILVFVGVFAFSLNNKDDLDIKIKRVDNPFMFFTVEQCVNKYIGLILDGNSEDVYNVIDKKYKEENSITIYNALSINVKLEGEYYFVAQEMLEDEDVPYKYYVRGELIEELMDEIYPNSFQYEVIVMLDVENNTYSVIPEEVGEYFDAL